MGDGGNEVEYTNKYLSLQLIGFVFEITFAKKCEAIFSGI